MPIQKQTACCRRQKVNGQEQLLIETAGGRQIMLSDGATGVAVEDGLGNLVQFEGGTVTVRAVRTVVVQAATVQIVASQVTLNAAEVTCTGVLQASTVIAETVSAATYTPGAGNVW